MSNIIYFAIEKYVLMIYSIIDLKIRGTYELDKIKYTVEEFWR